MKQVFNFRQGIVNFPKRPNFFLVNRDNCINLTLSDANPAILNFAHGRQNYFVKLSANNTCAWIIPKDTNVWPYWEINPITAEIEYKVSLLKPQYGFELPLNASIGQFFFDKNNTTMKYWNGQKWIDKIVLFLGEFRNKIVINLYANHSQVDLNHKCSAGEIQFDRNNEPIKRYYDNKYLNHES